MRPVEDEGLLDVVSIGDGEDPAPELVVLGDREGGVVGEPVPVEGLAVEEHRRVEERASRRAPGSGSRPGHPGRGGRGRARPRGRELDHSGADDGERGRRAQTGDLELEPSWERDVVGVHASDDRRPATARSRG